MAVQETRNLPAQFVEDLGVDLAEQVTAQSGVPVVTQGLADLQKAAQAAGIPATKQAFETQEQFDKRKGLFDAQQRAALGFEQRQLALQGLAPQVAGLSGREIEARKIADAGIGSFRPFLATAQTLTGAGAGTGAGSIASYMSPYQQSVIDATLDEYDIQAQKGQQGILDAASRIGALGAGRTGVQMGEYQAASDRNRAAIQAGLLQQGYGQAQAARQQDYANQMGLGQYQQGLGQYQSGLASLTPQLVAGQIGTMGTVGATQQAQAQAVRDAQREANRMAAYEPYERMGYYGTGVTGLMGGYPGQYQFGATPNPTPLQNALGIGSVLGGIYGNVVGPQNPKYAGR